MTAKRPSAQFPGLTPPSTDFESVLDGMRSPLLMLEVDLSTARSFAANTAEQIKITGNSFYIDQAPDVGNAYVIFEGVQDDTGPKVRPAVYVQPGYVARVPFANVRIVNSAQAGKVLRIIYGVDVDFVPSLNGQIAITGTVEASPYGFQYASAHKASSNLAALTAEAAFAPGSNTSGAILWRANMHSALGGNNRYSIIAHTSAPATLTTGDVLALGFSNGTSNRFETVQIETPIYIPAGKGLYFLSEGLETTSYRSALYTLL